MVSSAIARTIGQTRAAGQAAVCHRRFSGWHSDGAGWFSGWRTPSVVLVVSSGTRDTRFGAERDALTGTACRAVTFAPQAVSVKGALGYPETQTRGAHT